MVSRVLPDDFLEEICKRLRPVTVAEIKAQQVECLEEWMKNQKRKCSDFVFAGVIFLNGKWPELGI